MFCLTAWRHFRNINKQTKCQNKRHTDANEVGRSSFQHVQRSKRDVCGIVCETRPKVGFWLFRFSEFDKWTDSEYDVRCLLSSGVLWFIAAVGFFVGHWMFTLSVIPDFVNENIVIFVYSRCRWNNNSCIFEQTNPTKNRSEIIPLIDNGG